MDSAVEVSDSTTATIGTPSDTFGDGPDLWISRSTCLESVDIPHVCWSEKFLLLLPTCCFSKNITIFCWLNQAESPFLSFSRTRMCSIYMCWYPPNVFLFDVLQLFSAKNVAFPKKKKTLPWRSRWSGNCSWSHLVWQSGSWEIAMKNEDFNGKRSSKSMRNRPAIFDYPRI